MLIGVEFQSKKKRISQRTQNTDAIVAEIILTSASWKSEISKPPITPRSSMPAMEESACTNGYACVLQTTAGMIQKK